MKLFFIASIFLFSLVSAAKCLDISGTYLMQNAGGGMPTCGAGQFSETVWRKYSQENCEAVVISKVYKLKNGEICEGPISTRRADGLVHKNEGSDYEFSYSILEDKHELNLTNTNDGQKSKLTFTLNGDGNMVQHVEYLNGSTETTILFRSKVQ